jgi:hypothetical protein
MDKLALEVADIFRHYGEEYRKKHSAGMSAQHFRVMRDVEVCRTVVLGGHMKVCEDEGCGYWEIAYNSCRNRHCPKCQSMVKANWLAARQSEILPVDYSHLIFTIPDNILGPIALQNKDIFYTILFYAASHARLTTAGDPRHLGAQIGFFAILHTWGQKLTYHPHLHCLAPGGGLSPDREKWISCSPEFFLDVEVLSRCFQQLLLASLEKAFKKGFLQFHGSVQHLAAQDDFDQLLDACREIDWVVYAKPPFAGPETVLDYLARYTHRVSKCSFVPLSIRMDSYSLCRTRHNRHSCAVNMLARGLSASDVKNRLGHDNLQSTMTYLHMDLNLRRHIQKRYINYMQSVIKLDTKIEELLQCESDKDMIAWLDSL